ncbi:unnamed protein product (macronuclear) [Paramecium tetraurelia]|uniref:Uncharacterized protein n=1 Tax=Paramecium tetraurelia TaxID=5888 RepID=A0CXC6_PARTE|nr:uncharacterized protein GSPATT00011075001 [Paramecium tetraurelia]CAK75443.1 unnamed protein product [Paramecium tetraurelia]|eukprot:XP_001442840.1 hypothetical protein (macronuclear) [Paramecium tetraurelia strain d4-2]
MSGHQIITQPQSRSQYQSNNNILTAQPIQQQSQNPLNYPSNAIPAPFMPSQMNQQQYAQSQVYQPRLMENTVRIQQQPETHCPFCLTCQQHKTDLLARQESQKAKPQGNGNFPEYEYGVCPDCEGETGEGDPEDDIGIENQKLRDDIAAKAKANRKLRNDVVRLQTELDRIKHLPEENEKLKAMIGPLEDQLRDARHKNQDLLDDNNKLGNQVKDLRNNIDKANNAAKDNDNMKKEIEELKKKTKDNDKVMEENNDLKNKLNRLKGDRDKMLADLAALEKQNGAIKDKLGKLAKENNDLQKDLGDLKKVNKDLEKKCNDLQLDNDNLHLNLGDVKGDRDKAKDQLNDLHKNRNQLLDELGKVRDKLKDAEKDKDDLGKKLNNVQNDAKKAGDVPKLKRQLDNALLELDDLKAEREELDQHLKQVHDDYNKALKILKENGLLGLLDPSEQQPNQKPLNTNGQLGPSGQAFNPNGQPLYGSNGQPLYGPNGQPQYGTQNGQPVFGPNGQPIYGPNGQPIYGSAGQYGQPGSAYLGTPNQIPQNKIGMNPMNQSNQWGGVSGNVGRPSYEELILDNIRMKKCIDQLNYDLKNSKR